MTSPPHSIKDNHVFKGSIYERPLASTKTGTLLSLKKHHQSVSYPPAMSLRHRLNKYFKLVVSRLGSLGCHIPAHVVSLEVQTAPLDRATEADPEGLACAQAHSCVWELLLQAVSLSCPYFLFFSYFFWKAPYKSYYFCLALGSILPPLLLFFCNH